MSHMCAEHQQENNICIYGGSTHHSSENCSSQPNVSREESRPKPRDLLQSRTSLWGKYQWVQDFHEELQPILQILKTALSYRDYRYDLNMGGCQQTRFDERYGRQYSPNHILSTLLTTPQFLLQDQILVLH